MGSQQEANVFDVGVQDENFPSDYSVNMGGKMPTLDNAGGAPRSYRSRRLLGVNRFLRGHLSKLGKISWCH